MDCELWIDVVDKKLEESLSPPLHHLLTGNVFCGLTFSDIYPVFLFYCDLSIGES